MDGLAELELFGAILKFRNMFGLPVLASLLRPFFTDHKPVQHFFKRQTKKKRLSFMCNGTGLQFFETGDD
jgi:hypothetical protein